MIAVLSANLLAIVRLASAMGGEKRDVPKPAVPVLTLSVMPAMYYIAERRRAAAARLTENLST
jgi:hypothetical protein